MTSASMVTFICGIISCCIGVATFVTGMISRARQDGQLMEKLDFALIAIDEIKDNVKSIQSEQSEQNSDKAELIIRVKQLEKRVLKLEDKYDEQLKH